MPGRHFLPPRPSAVTAASTRLSPGGWTLGRTCTEEAAAWEQDTNWRRPGQLRPWGSFFLFPPLGFPRGRILLSGRVAPGVAPGVSALKNLGAQLRTLGWESPAPPPPREQRAWRSMGGSATQATVSPVAAPKHHSPGGQKPQGQARAGRSLLRLGGGGCRKPLSSPWGPGVRLRPPRAQFPSSSPGVPPRGSALTAGTSC